jgi:hypothetical protein
VCFPTVRLLLRHSIVAALAIDLMLLLILTKPVIYHTVHKDLYLTTGNQE